MKTIIEVEEHITASLVALGNTPDEVAESLKAKGITGRRLAACACPLANYINSLGYTHAGVADDFTCDQLVNNEPHSDYKKVYVGLPPACANFVRMFDCDDKYEDLKSSGSL